MAAFNWIIVTEDCPACGAEATLRCQTGVASSLDGDERGRFCNAEYLLGQTMNWWPTTDARYPEWHVFGPAYSSADPSAPFDEDECLATCTSCRAELVVVISFERATPIAVVRFAAG